MYRYSGNDNIVTYTPEDMILFKESPFACWMERLTLENPGHGILPDTGTEPGTTRARPLRNIAFKPNTKKNTASPLAWEDFVHVRKLISTEQAPAQSGTTYTFHVESGDVFVVDQELEEPLRRAKTIEAMRSGTRFIINGHLATGPLSARVGLLIRGSGYSQLGDYLYMPCSTRHNATRHETFRLCFAADLLHDLQGQLPPQILVMSDNEGLVSLQTEDHIYHYRAVKHRFMTEQSLFRKHRMPDPLDSSHFGRWSSCANDLIKRRALLHVDRGQQHAKSGSVPSATGHIVSDQAGLQPELQNSHDEGGTPGVKTFDSRLITNAEAG